MVQYLQQCPVLWVLGPLVVVSSLAFLAMRAFFPPPQKANAVLPMDSDSKGYGAGLVTYEYVLREIARLRNGLWKIVPIAWAGYFAIDHVVRMKRYSLFALDPIKALCYLKLIAILASIYIVYCGVQLHNHKRKRDLLRSQLSFNDPWAEAYGGRQVFAAVVAVMLILLVTWLPYCCAAYSAVCAAGGGCPVAAGCGR